MRWLAYLVLAYLVLGIQLAISGYVEIGGAAPNLILLVVIFLGVNGVREQVLLGCFLLGVMQDMLTLHPIGTWAVAYGLVALFVVSTQEVVYKEHPLTHFSLALMGGILCGVIMSIHEWVYPMLHGKGSAQVSSVALFASAVYSAVLAPIVLGILQRMKGTFGFRRRGA